jgi:hypothetical protein
VDQKLSHEESESIAQLIVVKLQRALTEKNSDCWVNLIYSEDDLANEAQRNWFSGYILNSSLQQATIGLLAVSSEKSGIIAKCRVQLYYQEFDPVEEIHIYTIAKVAEGNEYRIVWLSKAKKHFPGDKQGLAQQLNFEYSIIDPERDWWLRDEWRTVAWQCRDPLPGSVYARAIPRNIRFREAYPMLECATILAEMMSLKVVQLAAQVYSPNPLDLLKNLYYGSKDRIIVQLTRPDRDNTWASKLTASWFGFDEMDRLRGAAQTVISNCAPVMSVFYAILRLGGIAGHNLYQLRLHNQDIILFKKDREMFLLSSDEVIKLTPRTLYHTRNLTKIFNDCFYWTNLGSTNMGVVRQDMVRNFLGAANIFNFNFQVSPEMPVAKAEEGLPGLNALTDLWSLNREIKKKVLYYSHADPLSPFTWAKYAYQTLLVSKPSAYAACSLQSAIVRTELKQWKNREDFFSYLKLLEGKSIFIENDRIMIADQVIRYRQGDAKSLALLAFCWFRLQEDSLSFVLITTSGIYCAWQDAGGLRIYDTQKREMANRWEGSTVLAFDEKNEFMPARREADTEQPPVWHCYLYQDAKLKI